MSITTDTSSSREADESTRIKISGPVADALFNRKIRRKSYNDVLERVLDVGTGEEGGR